MGKKRVLFGVWATLYITVYSQSSANSNYMYM